MALKCRTIDVGLAHSKSVMSDQPVVITPTLAGSMTHSKAYLKSSQSRASPSDHMRPSLRVHVTVMASPPVPGATTPPFSVVGTSVARSAMYR
jgi:hypothetical protein